MPDLDDDDAAVIALRAMTFLAEAEGRLSRFLALTGLDPGALASGAGERGVQAAVLDHLLGDESLMLVFAADAGLDPAAIVAAHARLAGTGIGRGLQ